MHTKAHTCENVKHYQRSANNFVERIKCVRFHHWHINHTNIERWEYIAQYKWFMCAEHFTFCNKIQNIFSLSILFSQIKIQIWKCNSSKCWTLPNVKVGELLKWTNKKKIDNFHMQNNISANRIPYMCAGCMSMWMCAPVWCIYFRLALDVGDSVKNFHFTKTLLPFYKRFASNNFELVNKLMRHSSCLSTAECIKQMEMGKIATSGTTNWEIKFT